LVGRTARPRDRPPDLNPENLFVTRDRTESIYRLYAIVAERDIADGLGRVAAFQRKVASSRK